MLTGSSFAQNNSEDWFPVGTQWIYTERGLGIPQSEIVVEVIKDTIIEAESCRILEIQDEWENFPGGIPNVILCPVEDRVLQYAEGAFHILYDFNVQAGDTIEMYVPYGGVNDSKRHKQVVDSVKVLNIGGGEFRAYWTDRIFDGSSWLIGGSFPIVERFGGLGFLVPEDELSETTRGPLQYYQDTCFAVEINYGDCTNTGCSYNMVRQNCALPSPIQHLYPTDQLGIYPNPASHQLILT